MFALLVDRHRNPVTYRSYAGGYFEGHTLKDAVATLRQEYCVGKVIIVGDRGMLSKKNLAWFDEQQVGAHYAEGMASPSVHCWRTIEVDV